MIPLSLYDCVLFLLVIVYSFLPLSCCAYDDHVGRELPCAAIEEPAVFGHGEFACCYALRVKCQLSDLVCWIACRVVPWVVSPESSSRYSSEHDAWRHWRHWRHRLAASGGLKWLEHPRLPCARLVKIFVRTWCARLRYLVRACSSRSSS
jgi:hypothetical protein